MKIRTGFVSNSSSSSFCILGIETDYEEITQMLFGNNKNKMRGCSHSVNETDSFCSVCGKPVWIEREYYSEDIEKEWQVKYPNLGYFSYFGDDYYFVGWDLEGATFSELTQYKAEVEELENLFDDKVKVHSGEYAC